MRPQSRALRSLGTLIPGLLLAAACSGGDGGDGGPTPGFELQVSPTSVTIQAGGFSAGADLRASQDITVSIARGGGFTGAVTVTVEGLPAGVSATGLTIAAGQTTGIVTLSAAANATAGAATLTVRGTGTDVAARTATVALTVTPAPAFTMSINPTGLTIPQGGNGNTTITLVRSGGFTGSVDFSSGTQISGVTITFAPPSTTGNTSTATISVGGGVAAGTYQVQLRASFALLPTQTATLNLTVTAPTPGGFTLQVLPPQLTIQQGGNANSNVAITRSGSFTGAVSFTATSQPAGLNVTFNPTPAPGANTTVNVAAPAALAAGAYVVTIRGTGTGATDQSVPLNVTVTATPGGTTVNYVFCAAGGIPVWFAFQSGSGAGASPWTAVTPIGGNTFSFVQPFGVTTGAVAWVMQQAGKTALTIVNASTAELVAQGTALCPPAAGTKAVNGSVTGLGGTEVATVSLGTRSTQVFGAVPGGAFALTNVEDGSRDLLVSVYNNTNQVTNRVGFRRNQNPANGATLAAFNVATEGVAPVPYTLTIDNRDVDFMQVVAMYRTGNGTSGLLFTGPQGQVSTQLLPGVPAAQQVAGDLHMSVAVATPAGAVNGFPYRSVTGFYTAGSNRTIALPPNIADPVITTLATAPYVRPQASQTIVADLKDYFAITWTPNAGTVGSVTVSGTFAYYGAGPFLALVPDFTGTTGWNNAWGLQTGVPTAWTTFAASWNGPSVIGAPTIQDGTVAKVASRAGTRTF